MKRLLLAIFIFAAVLTLPTQADFFLCNPNCTGTPNSDLMSGSEANNIMIGDAGNDLMFGGDGFDALIGDAGNDVIFGGNNRDEMSGGPGNDLLLPGPDNGAALQSSFGNLGNDNFIILAGETENCQNVSGDEDFDQLHLIGFGPYVAEYPYGQPEPIPFPSYVVIQDPVAGGYIFVRIGDNVLNMERINGLVSPNVVVLDTAGRISFQNQNCPRIL